MEQSEKEDEEFGLGHIIYEIWISHPNGDIQRLSEYTRLDFRRERGDCTNLWVKNEWTAEKAVIWWDGQGMSEHREIKKSEVLAPRWPIFCTGGNVEEAAKTQDKAVRWGTLERIQAHGGPAKEAFQGRSVLSSVEGS